MKGWQIEKQKNKMITTALINKLSSINIIKMIKNTSIIIGVKIKPTSTGKQPIAQSIISEGSPPTIVLNIGGGTKKI